MKKVKITCNRRPSPVILCSAETLSVLCEPWPLVNRHLPKQPAGGEKMVETFGATSTTEEVLSGIDLPGKRILVAGVSAGLGVETARSLAAHGAQVVGTARDLAKAEA